MRGVVLESGRNISCNVNKVLCALDLYFWLYKSRQLTANSKPRVHGDEGKVDERIGEEEGKEWGEEERLVAYLCLEEVWLVAVSPVADVQQPGRRKTKSKELNIASRGHLS